MTSETRSNATIELDDGRRLGYADLGTPEGVPFFFFHGTPGSRLGHVEHDALATIPGVRLLLPERPGYGLSDPKPDRTLLDWARDVAQLADHLGIERFAVGGESGGGPHALACAAALGERVSMVILLASPAPASAPAATRNMAFGNRLGVLLG
ncbi:MAG: alpha/beta hydrolase, partial [Acidobacteriota bacterium]